MGKIKTSIEAREHYIATQEMSQRESVSDQRMMTWKAWQQTRDALSLMLAATVSERNASSSLSPEERAFTELMLRIIESLKNHGLSGLHKFNTETIDPDVENIIQQTSMKAVKEAEKICNSQSGVARMTNVVNELSGLVKLFGRARSKY